MEIFFVLKKELILVLFISYFLFFPFFILYFLYFFLQFLGLMYSCGATQGSKVEDQFGFKVYHDSVGESSSKFIPNFILNFID